MSKSLVEPLEQQIRDITSWVPHLIVSLSFEGSDIPHTRATDVVDQLMMAPPWQVSRAQPSMDYLSLLDHLIQQFPDRFAGDDCVSTPSFFSDVRYTLGLSQDYLHTIFLDSGTTGSTDGAAHLSSIGR
eukprot:1366396-Pyramimonas_sp.AAC.1